MHTQFRGVRCEARPRNPTGGIECGEGMVVRKKDRCYRTSARGNVNPGWALVALYRGQRRVFSNPRGSCFSPRLRA